MRTKRGGPWKWTKDWCKGLGTWDPALFLSLPYGCGLNQVTPAMLASWVTTGGERVMRGDVQVLSTLEPRFQQARPVSSGSANDAGQVYFLVTGASPAPQSRQRHTCKPQASKGIANPTGKKQGFPPGNMDLKNIFFFFFKGWMCVFPQIYIKVTHIHLRDFRKKHKEKNGPPGSPMQSRILAPREPVLTWQEMTSYSPSCPDGDTQRRLPTPEKTCRYRRYDRKIPGPMIAVKGNVC